MANHEAAFSDFIHDVFLSFCGETRHTFTDHLYHALCRNGINAFRDYEKLRTGDEIRHALGEAIEKSRISIIVFSENYASSTWCLDELGKIFECKEKGKMQLVLPIFYKVKPSDVRNQKNYYGEALIVHEKRFGKDSEKVKAWRSALSGAANIKGEHCRNDMPESEFIKKIVKMICAKLPPLPLQIKYRVGLDSRIEEVKSRINIESNDTVCMLEIYGPGGIGKTTFAMDLYNNVRDQFEAASFLENVREKSNKAGGLEDLQKTLLSEMGEETGRMIGSECQGRSEIKRSLGHKRIVLVLDDVDREQQLESLAGGCDWFGSGSIIIVTTRDKTVPEKGNVKFKIEKYEMKELNDGDSLELFSCYAFNMKEPAENFADIASRVVRYAKGIPLALRVIGSNLKGGSRKDWEIGLDKYRKVPDAEIQGVLEISYESLSEHEQKIFLDIACFFKGERWEYVERILKACDFYPVIRVFVNKCLINVNEYGCLEMHDLIQDMGREIVRKNSPSNLNERTRLWSHEEVLEVIKENLGSNKIEGIMLDPPQREEVDHWSNNALEKMKSLRILIVRNTTFSTGPTYLPNSLRLLDWEGCPSESFQPDFYPRRIVDFYLPRSRLILKNLQNFQDLTFINFPDCQSITQIPDVSGAKNLRVLTLDRCKKLAKVDKSIGFLPNLVCLSANECSAIKSFVPSIYLPCLEILSFNFCTKLESFPHVVQKMDKLLKILMIATAVKEFPDSIENLTGLEYMEMSICRGFTDLPNSLLLLPKLDTLKIEGCSQLRESFARFQARHPLANDCPNLKTLNLRNANLSNEDLHIILEIFPKLEDLNVSCNEFVSLPARIKESFCLKTLDVSFCRNLQQIPELPPSIQKVDARHCGSLTSEASSMLWSQVSKKMDRIEVVMPKTEIPESFIRDCEEEIPLFWARRKFPADIALAFVFGKVDEMARSRILSLDWQPVGLHLFIDGKEISPKDYHYFSVGEDHVLLCDLRVLFNDKEWQGLEAVSLGDDWKAIQVQCETDMVLSNWGVYVYNEETKMENIKFKLPNLNSGDYMPSSRLVPTRSPEQRARYMIESFGLTEKFDELLNVEEMDCFAYLTLMLWMKAKAVTWGEPSASAYGTSLKQEDRASTSELLQLFEAFKGTMLKQITGAIASIPEVEQMVKQLGEELLRIRQEIIERENAQGELNINMSIILEECLRFGEELLRIRH